MLDVAKGTIAQFKDTTSELRSSLAKAQVELEQRSQRVLDASDDSKYNELQARCDRYADLIHHLGMTTTELPQLRATLVQIAKESRRITQLTNGARKHDKEIITMKHRLRKERQARNND